MRLRRTGWAALAALAVCLWSQIARGEPMLYGGEGWSAVSGVPESAQPPDPGWSFEHGVWIGRISDDLKELKWGDRSLPVAEALPLPAGATVLSPQRNPWGPCLVHSLSVRYDSLVRSRRWSLVFNEEGQEPELKPIVLPAGPEVGLALALEDVVSGQRWELRPTRQGREGSLFSWGGDARLYAGTLDEGDLDWNLVVAPLENKRIILQGRIMVLKNPARLLRLRVMLRTGAPGVPVLQAESPPAVVSTTGGVAVALFADLAEPRRFRAVADASGITGLEFDLAVTKSTGNFPRSATFSLEVDAWDTSGPGAAEQEAVARLAHAGGSNALPEAVMREGLGSVPVIEPATLRLSHPGGFQDRADVAQYLMLKTSGLFHDREWVASAFLCAALDAQGETRITREGEGAIVAVNPDPDLQTMLAMGPNRGVAVWERIRQNGASAVWLKAAGISPGLDYSTRALYLCDYPAVWEAGSEAPGVDLRHAESELFAALACVLQSSGICLLVEDGGPMAPFTTYHADALVCASSDPAEMRRQRALAGARPVLWTATRPGMEAEELARNLGFVRP